MQPPLIPLIREESAQIRALVFHIDQTSGDSPIKLAPGPQAARRQAGRSAWDFEFRNAPHG